MEMNQLQYHNYPFGYLGDRCLYVRETRRIRMIECDIEEKWMKVKERKEDSLEWDELNLEGLIKGDIVDLNEKGERWEGDSLQHKPFGYGCIYDNENRLIYNGFIYEGMKVCFGSVFFGDVGIIEYCGTYYKNMRYGYGLLYNKKNELVYKGKWLNDNPIEISKVTIEKELQNQDIYFGLEEITICRGSMKNIECFKLIGFDQLKKLHIKDNRLKKMKQFCIEDCNELVDIVFDGGEDDDSFDMSFNEIDLANRNGVFELKNCNKLVNLKFGFCWMLVCKSVIIDSMRIISIYED